MVLLLLVDIPSCCCCCGGGFLQFLRGQLPGLDLIVAFVALPHNVIAAAYSISVRTCVLTSCDTRLPLPVVLSADWPRVPPV